MSLHIVSRVHLSNLKITLTENSIWIWFEIKRPVPAIKSRIFALLMFLHIFYCLTKRLYFIFIYLIFMFQMMRCSLHSTPLLSFYVDVMSTWHFSTMLILRVLARYHGDWSKPCIYIYAVSHYMQWYNCNCLLPPLVLSKHWGHYASLFGQIGGMNCC